MKTEIGLSPGMLRLLGGRVAYYPAGPTSESFSLPARVAEVLKWGDNDEVRNVAKASLAELQARGLKPPGGAT